MFQAKDALVRNQQLKVQELSLTNKDGSILIDNGADHIVVIGEPVSKVLIARMKDDSANAWIEYAQASISIVDSSAYTAGGDLKAIKITGLATVDTDDVVVVKYICAE